MLHRQPYNLFTVLLLCLAVMVGGPVSCIEMPTPPRVPGMPAVTPPAGLVRAGVTSIIDGDTIAVVIDGRSYRVRYIGIDSPETADPVHGREPFSAEATEANRRLVAGRVVGLERDTSETDRYGRLLRYVWVGNVLVNAELVRQGYAHAATFPPDVKYQALFLRLQQEAQAAGRGLWASRP